MRVYELRGKGLENLVAAERPSPRPGAGEVRVRIRAASLNHRDLAIALGQYARSALRYPLVPLSDGAGEVIEVGAGVPRLQIGDRVMGGFFRDWIDGPATPENTAAALGGDIDGVLAEEVVLRADAVVKVPAALSFEEAATLPCAGVTAWVGLTVLGDLKPGQTVLALGTGGVSLFVLQIAKALGARVILTSSQDDKLARGRALGADATINYKQTPIWDVRARELTRGHGVDQILEVGGAHTVPLSVRALRDGGHLTLVGFVSGGRATAEMAHNDRGIRVDSVYVGSARHLQALADAVARFGIRPVVDQVFLYSDARLAYEHMRGASHFGKIVIRL